MLELTPFTEADIDRLLEWVRSRQDFGVFHVNPGAIACYEKVGFRQEGVRRDSFKVPEEGSYWSEVVMSILAPEWAASKETR